MKNPDIPETPEPDQILVFDLAIKDMDAFYKLYDLVQDQLHSFVETNLDFGIGKNTKLTLTIAEDCVECVELIREEIESWEEQLTREERVKEIKEEARMSREAMKSREKAKALREKAVKKNQEKRKKIPIQLRKPANSVKSFGLNRV